MEQARLQKEYIDNIRPTLMKKLGYKNVNEVPKLEKIVVNVGVGEAVQDPKVIDIISNDLAMITGQRPEVRRARKSIAQFHLRKGMPIGLRVTLRKRYMYDFLDRLINFALPRVRDFSGLPLNSFDGRGNYNFGLSEHTVFPEVEIDKVKKVFGMNITIVTTAKRDDEARALLSAFGFPFERRED